MDYKPKFDFDKFNIGFDEIAAEIDTLAKPELPEQPEGNATPFPVEVFPLPVRQIIEGTNTSLNFPVDFIGVSILYSVALAVGNTYKVEVKRGWQETAVLYLAIVGRAGTNKSHPLTFALQPIANKDKETYRHYEQQKQEFDQAIRLSKKERAEQGIDEPVKPVWKKFIVSDFTPEALAEVHKFNKRGIGVYSDELAGWLKNFNRYHKGAEQEFWLSVWSAKPINIDRKTGEPVFIPQPFIPVIGTIQNGVLDEIGKDSRTQNGFIDRILFAIPDKLEKSYWSETEISPALIDSWENIINNLLQLPCNLDESLCPKSEILKFTPEAWNELKGWQRYNTDLSNNAENEQIGSIYSKLEVYAVRLALILEMLHWACDEGEIQAVGTNSVQGAIQLTEYFRNTALRVHSIISNSSPLDKLPSDKKRIYEALPNEFTTETGVEIAEQEGMKQRTFKRWLNDRDLFTRLSRGEYEKRF
jgi:hypothetical protein